MADINADGFADIVRSKYQGEQPEHFIYLNNAAHDGQAGWTRDDSMPPTNSEYTDFSQGATLIDLNGDGLHVYLVIPSVLIKYILKAITV